MQRRPALAIGTPSLSFECIPIVLSRCKRARFRHRARIGMKDEAKNVPHLRGQKLSRQAKVAKVQANGSSSRSSSGDMGQYGNSLLRALERIATTPWQTSIRKFTL
ncbi:hypothetical protein Tco_0668841 [Tanacetum coccineum]